ncbi:MAG TPA: sensor histidine kinase [Marmoricola sp.]
MPLDVSLSSRVIATNGLLFASGTALLAFSPATVSARPVLSEVMVLAVGLTVIIVANALLVRAALRPLDRLVGDLQRNRAADNLAPVAVPKADIAKTVASGVNELLARIDDGQRAAGMAALAGQEAERARIAQELHDGVGQSLTALLLELRRIDDPALEGVRDGLRTSLEEVRRVARQLRPHVLEDLGLRSALAALSTELFAHLPTHVVRGIVPGLPALDEATELVVFRVAQEALTNTARHADAETVHLTLATRGDRLVLTIADDGRGIAPGTTPGTGLRGMEERAALVGGEIEVARRDGGGTVVTLEVPLASRRDEAP